MGSIRADVLAIDHECVGFVVRALRSDGTMAKFTEYQDMISAELEAAGISSYSFSIGGKHPYVEFEFDGKTHKRVFPGTPSDRRSFLNQKMDFRRKLRDLGAGILEKKRESDNVAIETTDMTIRGGYVIVSSMTLAEKFGRQHKDVLRAIDNLLKDTSSGFNRRNFTPVSYSDIYGRPQRAYDLTKHGFSMVAMGFTGKKAIPWKERFFDAFDAMEEAIRNDPIVEIKAELSAVKSEVAILKAELSAATELLMETRTPIAIAPPQQSAMIITFKHPYMSDRMATRKLARRQAIN